MIAVLLSLVKCGAPVFQNRAINATRSARGESSEMFVLLSALAARGEAVSCEAVRAVYSDGSWSDRVEGSECEVATWSSSALGGLMLGQWTFFIAAGHAPELRTEPLRIAFHLAAKSVTAVALIAAGVMPFRHARQGGTGRSSRTACSSTRLSKLFNQNPPICF